MTVARSAPKAKVLARQDGRHCPARARVRILPVEPG